MNITLQPYKVAGSLAAPASKSVMQRACAAALLFNGTTLINNYGQSNDDKAALDMIQVAGATVKYLSAHQLEIRANGTVAHPRNARYNCGESGLSLRMFTPIIALGKNAANIAGQGSLLKRPVHFFEEILPLLGVQVKAAQGSLPLQIQGPLLPADIAIDGSLTSQFLTGLLMAYSASGRQANLAVKNLASKPYVDVTLAVMEAFGMNMPVNDNYEHFSFRATKKQTPRTVTFDVGGDWSNAAFLLAAGAIGGALQLKGLDVFSEQADKKILEALQQCGCQLSIETEAITVANNGSLQPIHIDATHCPDLFPPLVALAAYANGTSVIEGVHRLRHKESNRALALQQEWAKFGLEISFQDDAMIIKPPTEISPASIHSHNDHRIAMAAAVTACKATGPVTIEHAEAVKKSYPDFFEDLQQIAIIEAPWKQ
ncbi:MAG: 3-phosphoshikimate 1-carboxyvinyltransferase [Edaphocola sp.]